MPSARDGAQEPLLAVAAAGDAPTHREASLRPEAPSGELRLLCGGRFFARVSDSCPRDERRVEEPAERVLERRSGLMMRGVPAPLELDEPHAVDELGEVPRMANRDDVVAI